MTSPVCARCGCPATEYTPSCRACYSRRRYRARAPQKPAVTLTMNLKSLSYVTELLTCGRIAAEEADTRKKKPFHD